MLGSAKSVRDQPPSARPDRRTARREATKAEILDAAWDLVHEHGLAALSLRDLADRVGMRAPSLYQYFPSKHAIYDAMYAQGMRAALDVSSMTVASEDARAALLDRARRMFEFATSDPERAQLLFQRVIPGFEPEPETYAVAIELNRHTSDALAAVGITGPDALDLYTALMSGLFNQQIANDPGGDRWGRLVDRAIEMYLAELAPAVRASKSSKSNKTSKKKGT
jgi:AcrR family transcriptional regulator